MKKILIPILAILIPVGALTAYNYAILEEEKKAEIIKELVISGLGVVHYDELKLDDDFSEQLFDVYLERIDYSRNFLLEEDVEKMKKYRRELDDQIRNKRNDFFDLSIKLIEKRKKEAEAYYIAALEQPFDFSLNETIELDGEKKDYAANKEELKNAWRKSMKYQVMLEVFTKSELQQKAHEKSDTVELKSFEELEHNAREKVRERNADWFRRMKQVDRMDYLSQFLNSVSNMYDPHTTYYPPKDKEDFDISMSGQLEGIGATLTSRDGYVKVAKVVPGSPSWKQGDLKDGDLILKVAQEGEEAVDVVGMRLDKAVKLIRGKKGTKVILTVKKMDGEIVEIPIVRDVVVLEETYTKSMVLESSKDGKKYGYIYLPQFYVDFNKKDGGRRASDDILKEINKLKKENVEGLVFDLRNNGGGSLPDAIKMAGFFIEKGPVVQVKEKSGNVMKHNDHNASVEYDGPMVVMVNNGSASASEIFAAAMQDYNRAVILGGKTTFGKGTVQNVLDLDRFINKGFTDLKPFGALKVTVQKFYRVNGGSTQLKGVHPDIVLPDQYMFIDVGEKELDHHLEWDEIPKADYTAMTPGWDVSKLRKNVNKRIKSDPDFTLIREQAEYLKDVREKTVVSLNYEAYTKMRAERKEMNDRYKAIMKDTMAVNVMPLQADQLLAETDSVKRASAEKWQKNLKKDIYLRESLRVLEDLNIR